MDPCFQCACCLSHLVLPVTLPCGHSFCLVHLEQFPAGESGYRTCPTCRAVIPETKFSINILLDNILHEKIPDYEDARKAAREEIDNRELLKKYYDSKRFYDISLRFFKLTLKRYVLLCPLKDTTITEQMVVVDKLDKLDYICLGDKTYIFNRDSLAVNTHLDFISKHRTELTTEQILYLIGKEDIYKAYTDKPLTSSRFFEIPPTDFLKDMDLSPRREPQQGDFGFLPNLLVNRIGDLSVPIRLPFYANIAGDQQATYY